MFTVPKRTNAYVPPSGFALGKGGKYKKKSGKAKHTLTQEDIEFLKKNTRYDEQEIKEWYR